MQLDNPTGRRLVLLEQGATEYCGGWFDHRHRELITTASEQPHFALVEIDLAKLDQINPDIRPGYLLPNGQPDTLPTLTRGTFYRLAALAMPSGLAATAAACGLDKTGTLLPWSEIRAGSVVLARDGRDEGWWECVVLAIEGVSLRLRWRDFLDLDAFHRPISCVGLLSPSGLG